MLEPLRYVISPPHLFDILGQLQLDPSSHLPSNQLALLLSEVALILRFDKSFKRPGAIVVVLSVLKGVEERDPAGHIDDCNTYDDEVEEG